MANLGFNDVQSRTKAVKKICGRISILGNTTPANGTYTVDRGDGVASVARTGAGEYTLTLTDTYRQLVGFALGIQAAAAIDLVPQMKSHDVVVAKTIVLNLLAGATPTDTANGVQQYLYFEFSLKNTDAR